MRRAIYLSLLLTTGAAMAKDPPLPTEVTVRQGDYNKRYIDSFRYRASTSVFAKVKLCLAQTVSNPAVTITGGTDAPFAFQSNMRTQTSTIQGGGIFKYDDADAGVVIVNGSIDGGSTMLGMSRDVVRYELMASVSAEGTLLTFSKIDRATINTGSATNQGFAPVGVWKGARPLKIIDSLRGLAANVDACLR